MQARSRGYSQCISRFFHCAKVAALIFTCVFGWSSILGDWVSFWPGFDGIIAAPSVACDSVRVASFVGSLVRARFHRRRILLCHSHFVLNHLVCELVADSSWLLLDLHIKLFELDSMRMISLHLSVATSGTHHRFFFLLLLFFWAQQLALLIVAEHMGAHSVQRSFHIAC